jgi:hypothetical protein
LVSWDSEALRTPATAYAPTLCAIFMRKFYIILLLTITTRLLSQDFKVATKGDTLTIRAINITTDPFQFGDNPLSYLEKFDPRRTFETVENNHVENKIDTTFTLTIGKDNFKVTKWDKDQTGLLSADLTTNKFKTKHGLQIGMKKNEVIEKLRVYKLKSIPGLLILEDGEVYELLILKFTADRLTKITFQGYYD